MASSSSYTFDTRSRKGSFKANFTTTPRSRKNSILSTTGSTIATDRDALLSKIIKDPKLQKEARLRHKIRTYEMYLAMSKGYMMSSSQLCAWVRYYLHNSSVLDSRNRRLNSQGKVFVRDLRAWVEAVVDLIEEKNYDDKIQDFLWQTSRIQQKMHSSRNSSHQGNSRHEGDVAKAMTSLRQLGSLIYGSTEFRRLLSELILVTQDIFADAASAALSKLDNQAGKAEGISPQYEIPDSIATGSGRGTPTSVADDVAAVSRKNKSQQARVKLRRHDSRDEVENFLRQKFPKQRRDSLINRLKKAFADIQKDPEFVESVEFLMNLMKAYLQRLNPLSTDKGKEADTEVVVNDEFDNALEKLKEILSALAGGKNLDDVSERFMAVVDDVNHDSDILEFYKDASDYLYALLQDKEFVLSDPADSEGHQLFDRATELFNTKKEQYRSDVEELLVEMRLLGQAIESDKAISRVTEAGKKVWNDIVLVKNEGYGISFRRAVIRNMFDTMLPKFLAEVRYFPISRVEYQDKSIDLVLENVVLESDNFLPWKMSMETKQKAEFSTEWTYRSAYTATTHLALQNFSFYLKDASFLLRRRKGIFRFTDRGFLDVKCNASTYITLESNSFSDDEFDNTISDDGISSSDDSSFFRVRNIKVILHKFDYRYKNNKHSWLSAVLSPIIRPWVKKLLSQILQAKLRSMFETCDRELYGMAERVRFTTISSGGKGSMENWVRAVLSKPPLTQRKKDDGVMGDRRVEITVGKQELFPGERGPGPVVLDMVDAVDAKVDGQQERKGTWRTEVFDLRRNYLPAFAET